MAMQLRPYQQRLLRDTQQSFVRGRRAVMTQLATGGGKTAIAAEWIKSQGGNALFLCHTLSVIGQAPDELSKWGLETMRVGQGFSSWKHALRQPAFSKSNGGASLFSLMGVGNSLVVAATSRTAHNNLTNGTSIGKFSSVVVDEAHHAADPLIGEDPTLTTQIVTMAKDFGIPVMGITATPWRMSKTQGFAGTWDHLVNGPDWVDLRGEYLADPSMVVLRNSRSRIRGAGARANEDYTVKDTMLENISNPIFIEGAVDKVLAEGGGTIKKALIYAVGQVHALRVAEYIRSKGYPVGLLVSGKDIRSHAGNGIITDPDIVRTAVRKGELKLAVNVNMVTEGYDAPDVDIVCCLRPSLSLALWRQMCGRGSRLSPGKTTVKILDFTDNHHRLGSPLDKIEWSLLPRGKPTAGRPWMRSCTPERIGFSCGSKIFVGCHHCPECGEPQGKRCNRCGKFRFFEKFSGMTLFARQYGDSYGDICDFCLSSGHFKI